MRINLNKSTKRALSLVLAFAMLIGSLFTANIGINITADAATLTIKYWSGDSTAPTVNADGSYTINTPEELAYIVSNGSKYEKGTDFKVADGIDAFIMQPSSIIVDDDGNGVLDIMEISDYSKTQTFIAALSGKQMWPKGSSAEAFKGNFDGNGIQIYGLYAEYSDTGWGNGAAALFPYVGGDFASTESCTVDGAMTYTAENFPDGVTLENFAVRNSYFKGLTAAAVVAITRDANTSDNCYYGRVIVKRCEVSNCYIQTTRTDAAAGVLLGYYSYGLCHFGLNVDGCAMYNNKVVNSEGTDVGGMWGIKWNGITSGETTAAWYNAGFYSYKNIVSIGTNPGSISAGYNDTDINLYYKVYTDISKDTVNWNQYKTYTPDQVTILGSADDAKGSMGKLAMNLDWATDEKEGTWYAIDGEYPTLFKPEGWKDCETIITWDGTANDNGGEFAADAEGKYGDGTAEKPYLIETPEQLFAMVSTGGKVDGAPKYYKVKDGVKNLYLSKAITGGYAAAKACTDYHNWNVTTPIDFQGNFDGNGVTIRGMISTNATSTNVGLVQWLGENGVVKNVNFDNCYVKGGNSAAMVASYVTRYNDENADGTTTNCKYCRQYATEGVYCEFHNTYSSSNPEGKDSDQSGSVENCGDTQVSTCTIKDEVKCEVHNGGAKDGYNLIYNVSVRNCSIKASSDCCAGIIATTVHADMIQVVNSLFDGYSCELGSGLTEGSNAGIAAQSGINNVQLSGCISLGAKVITDNGETYNDYSTGNRDIGEDGTCHPVYIYNCYTDVSETVDTTVVEVGTIGADTLDYDYITNMPLIDWANGWYVAKDTNGRKVPMPRVRTAADVPATWDTGEVVLDYNRLLGTADGGAGRKPYNGGYGHFDKFIGSGTKDDPYIISTDLELARAIGAGGTDLNNKLYFKLTCDIDVSGMPWLNTVGAYGTSNGSTLYSYVPFEGVLDGDGHTITGLYAVNGNQDQLAHSEDWQAGLIPVLNGGEVKNLHIRNSYAATGAGYDNATGVLVGELKSGTVSGCSVVDVNGVTTLVGTNAQSNNVTNSYIDDTYYDADGTQVTADTITVDYGTGAENPVWYKGGAEGSIPRLVNRAAAMNAVDVAGDDNNDYDGNDLSALRYKLLRKSAYQNIYGDVNSDGAVNSADLVILRRSMVGDYADVQDGFWRNVELGKVKIYYGENDNYDAARKLELYFESIYPGIDIQKLVSTSKETVQDTASDSNSVYLHEGTGVGDPNGTTDGFFDIIVGDIKDKTTTLTGNNYAITYENDTLWLQGANFTAVEQAVLDYVAETVPNAQEGGYTVASATLDPEKEPVIVGGTTYYYAWGDEFAETDDKTISSDNWLMNSYRSENEPDNASSTNYNKENPNLKDLKTLWVVDGGRLQIWRGVNTSIESIKNSESTWKWGYKGIDLGVNTTNDWGKPIDSADAYIDPGCITTEDSMLFKQGYVEMEASLPSDGHAFPAWWFLTYTEETNNTNIASSLYGKVFKENSKWNKSDKAIPTTPATYKYQLPTAHLEFDIVELMQTQTKYAHNGNWGLSGNITSATLTGNWMTNFNITVHKLYGESVYNDAVYQIDWDNLEANAIYDSYSEFNSTQGAGVWSHRYNELNFVNGEGFDNGITSKTNDIDMGTLSNLTGTYKYGFAWKVSGKNYSLELYIDTDRDGDMSDEKVVTTINQGTGHAVADQLSKDGTDHEIWNQYAYMLLDNGFYSANPNGSGTVKRDNILSDWTVDTHSAVEYTDLLKEDTDKSDKATFEVSYVRVYQENDKRDIVTPETENFNNGDHFGYGK